MHKVRLAQLEDWPNVAKLWENYQKSTEKPGIEGDLGAVKALFLGGLTAPQVGFLVIEGAQDPADLVGFGVVTEALATMPVNGTVQFVRHGFVRAILIRPKTSIRAALGLAQAIEDWGKLRGYPFLRGDCTEQYMQHAETVYTRLGWKKSHIVVCKNLEV